MSPSRPFSRRRSVALALAVVAVALSAVPVVGEPVQEAGNVVRLPSGQRLDLQEWEARKLRPRTMGRFLVDVFGNDAGSQELIDRLWLLKVASAKEPGATDLGQRLAGRERIEILSTLAGGFFIVRGSTRSLRKLEPFPGLSGIAALPWTSKVSPHIQTLIDLLETEFAPIEISPDATPQAVATERNPFGVNVRPTLPLEVWLFRKDDGESLLAWLESRGWSGVSGPEGTRFVMVREMPLSALSELAERLEVERILPAGLAQTFEDSYGCGLQVAADRVVPATVADRVPGIFPATPGLDGSGQIIGHADSGLDSGADTFHRHLDLSSGILCGRSIGRSGTEDATEGWSDPSGHGTHTAGLIIGSGRKSKGRFVGSAPGALLVHHSLSSDDGTISVTPSELERVLDEAVAEKARIHSDSWGFRLSDYAAISETLDRWAWADGAPKELLVVVAAGNDGLHGDGGTLSDPAAAKNCLTVGAVNTETGELDMKSSRGPTVDGRIKPDLVAPGTWLVSTRPRELALLVHQDMGLNGFEGWQQQGDEVWGATESGGRDGVAMSDSPEGDYSDNLETVLVSPPFSASAAREVRFWARWDVPEPRGYGLSWRFGSIQYWFAPEGPPLPARNPAWPGGDWITLKIPEIFRLAGWGKLHLGFHLRTDGSGTGDGVTIDDFQVSARNGCGMEQVGISDPGLEKAYFVDSGTSMATALVSGLAARYRQHLIEVRGLPDPSPMALKAALIHGTRRPPAPDRHQGWGVATIDLTQRPRVEVIDRKALAAGDAPYGFDFEVLDEGSPLRATLVWWDPPATRLVNDLDLVLLSPEVRSFPEVADKLNTVEDVFVGEPARGPWRAEVRGARIEEGAAPFALVISGAIRTPEGVLQAVHGQRERQALDDGYGFWADL